MEPSAPPLLDNPPPFAPQSSTISSPPPVVYIIQQQQQQQPQPQRYEVLSMKTIKDASGQITFTIKHAKFGGNMKITSVNGKKVKIIRRVGLLKPNFEIEIDNKLICIIREKLSLGADQKFDIEVAKGNTLRLEGSFVNQEYSIQRDDFHSLCTVSRRFFSDTLPAGSINSSHYGVEVSEGEDPLLCLAISLVLDKATHNYDL